jgi:hypothetical protein
MSDPILDRSLADRGQRSNPQGHTVAPATVFRVGRPATVHP